MSHLDSMIHKSNMNFHNWKLPEKGKSRVFKPKHSSRAAKAQQNTLGSKGKPVGNIWSCPTNYVCPYFHIGFWQTFFTYRNFEETIFDNNRFILVIKFEKLNLPKSLVSQVKKKTKKKSKIPNNRLRSTNPRDFYFHTRARRS